MGERRGHAVDWLTQRWVQLTGRRIELRRAPWLSGPCGSVRRIGADFFERWGEAQGLTALRGPPDDGLLDGLAALSGPAFDPAEVHPRIDDFYSRTAAFEQRIASRWSGPFRAVGWLVGRLFARRLAQLNMPPAGRAPRGGVESRIVRLADGEGQVRHTAWVRTSVQTGLPVFVGQYDTAVVPGHAGPCIRVVFPLPNGNAIVVLRPRADPGGGLTLLGDGGRFGDPGFYFTVLAEHGEVWARHVRTMKEQLSLRVEGEGIVARHRFRVFGLPFLELRYEMARREEGPVRSDRAP